MQSLSKRLPNMEIQKSVPRDFLVALKKSNLNTFILAECIIFCTFLDVKGQGILKTASKLLYLP